MLFWAEAEFQLQWVRLLSHLPGDAGVELEALAGQLVAEPSIHMWRALAGAMALILMLRTFGAFFVNWVIVASLFLLIALPVLFARVLRVLFPTNRLQGIAVFLLLMAYLNSFPG